MIGKLIFCEKCSNYEIFYRMPLELKGFLLMAIIIAVLHCLDRQGEYVARSDFLWKAKLKVEQEEVETMRSINKVNSI